MALMSLRSDTGAFAAGGSVSLGCNARAGGRALHAEPRFLGTANVGVVTCVVKVPKSVRGKVLRGSITATFGGTTLTKTFSARIK
jgi:hypothetical protein